MIRENHELSGIRSRLAGYADFVVKPAHGSGGNGILVVGERSGERLVKSSGQEITFEDLEYHITNVLSGMYSLGGHPDAAMIEYRVAFDPLFEDIAYRGVPDIRTLVFRGVPVMAMVRLPTRASDGRANLHQGAVGAGIDLASGRTTAAVYRNGIVTRHPDTDHVLAGLQIPNWTRLLDLAARCHDLTSLGYLGVDVVLDAHYGPLMLELNARPGISIQIANRAGLRHRLEAAERWLDSAGSASEGRRARRIRSGSLRGRVIAAAYRRRNACIGAESPSPLGSSPRSRSRAPVARRRDPPSRRAKRSTRPPRAPRKACRS